MIEVRVLGPLEVIVDGRAARIAGEKERAVLALLVAHAGETVSTDTLIDHLWGDDLPENPSNALQAVVSRLRRALGAEGPKLVTRRPGYALDVAQATVDALRFEELLTRARESHSPSEISSLLHEALSTWRGSAYADLAYVDVVDRERARLDELRLAALEEKIAADLALGRTGDALGQLERVVATHPLRERLRALMMLALYRQGRQADAIEVYQETRRLLDDELGVDPGPDLDALYQQILRQDPSLRPDAAPAGRTNVPVRITSFVGRESELAEVTSLTRAHRLVTLLGPGGAGKTSLAVEVARGLVDEFADGVWFAELAPVADPDLVVATLSEAAGLADDPATAGAQAALARLTANLRSKELLLVVDNCEHVVQAVAEAAESLLATCPGVKILATSREVLASSGEFVWTIPPLAVPDEGTDALTEYDAVRLLLERARAAGADIVVDTATASAAASICRRLDGLPLAIELAAARARSLALPDISQRLDRLFSLLTSGGRTTEPRHRTLRAAIDWSYDLLEEPEQTLFRRLGVFSGGWTLDAAEAVCGYDSLDVLDVQARLVDQSLVSVRDGRFWMLETILAYAKERLAAAGEEGLLRERHAHFFKDLAEAAEPELRGGDQVQALERLRVEEHNLRLALQWGRDAAAEQPDVGLGLAAALGWYWYVGRQVEGRSELSSMLAAAPGAAGPTRARALQALSLALRPAGCIVHASAEAAEAARRSIELFDSAGDRHRAALSRLLLAVEGVGGGDVERFLSLVEDARSTLRTYGDAWGLALADFVEMEIRLYHDSQDRALALGARAAEMFDDLADSWGRSAVRLHLGFGLRLAGRLDEARAALVEAVALSRATGLPNNLARSLAELGELAVHAGDPDEAGSWLAQADEIATDLADDTMLGLVAAGRGDLARYVGDASTARGHYARALTLYERADVPRGIARALTGAAAADADLGEYGRARSALTRGVPLARDAGDPAIHAGALEQMARLVAAEGDRRAAEALLLEADLLRARSRRPRGALAQRDIQLPAAAPGA